MRAVLLAFTLLIPAAFLGQIPATSPATVQAAVQQALVGDWVGALEYRDYSEPAGSTRRVLLPTWLTISPAGSNLTQHFLYDDGPTKTVDSTEILTFDVAASTYTETEPGKPGRVYKVAGYDRLKTGRGDLVLTGSSTDNDKPADTRITLTIRRNLLTWLEEVRPANTSEPYTFRHVYRFTRAQPPVAAKP